MISGGNEYYKDLRRIPQNQMGIHDIFQNGQGTSLRSHLNGHLNELAEQVISGEELSVPREQQAQRS